MKPVDSGELASRLESPPSPHLHGRNGHPAFDLGSRLSSPFPPATDSRSPATGQATLGVEYVDGQSAVTTAQATSPLKLLTPRPRGPAVWAFTSSFGGGMVGGDATRLDLHVGPDAHCLLGTQASTKIYRAKAVPSLAAKADLQPPTLRGCSHETHARVESNALLVFAPDPVQAFAGSRFEQRQIFHLAADAGLVLLDWVSSGRPARGERWAFGRFFSRNEVRVDGRTEILDALRLDPADGALDGAARMGRFNCLGWLAMIGPPLRDIAQAVLADAHASPVVPRAALAHSTSAVRGGVVLCVAAEGTEAVALFLAPHLRRLAPWLGDDPWSRKW